MSNGNKTIYNDQRFIQGLKLYYLVRTGILKLLLFLNNLKTMEYIIYKKYLHVLSEILFFFFLNLIYTMYRTATTLTTKYK